MHFLAFVFVAVIYLVLDFSKNIISVPGRKGDHNARCQVRKAVFSLIAKVWHIPMFVPENSKHSFIGNRELTFLCRQINFKIIRKTNSSLKRVTALFQLVLKVISLLFPFSIFFTDFFFPVWTHQLIIALSEE